jgi:undecaprenyl diphosphate synthase
VATLASLRERLLRSRRLGELAREPAQAKVASSGAIVMDGNGRWARRRGLPISAGHRAGTAALRRTVEAAPGLGIRSLCVYAFSTENWQRPDDEVAFLMELFGETIEREFPELARQGVRIVFGGRRDRISPATLALMEDMEERTAANTRLDLFVAFDYGGRAEIVEACRRLIAEGTAAADVDAAAIAARLAMPGFPDPDLVIRASGEQRLSNFLLWQSAYAEYVFSPVLWPDFGEDALRDALAEYGGRRRRFGRR